MISLPSSAAAEVSPLRSLLSFRVRESTETPAYHQLLLEDPDGHSAQWVIPVALNKLARKPVLLWLLPTPASPGLGTCVETGTVQLTPGPTALEPQLPALLAQGLLQLNFGGQLLRGYHRLRCLQGGNGQLWQLTPISYV